jgi:hypothetical protein
MKDETSIPAGANLPGGIFAGIIGAGTVDPEASETPLVRG